ncbi:MAG TPA: hypothetical protein VF044_05240 [Actinomycetota bacterium]
MTPLRVARAMLHLLLVVVLVAAGTYLLVYLYRWEWNRALISGLFFVIAEVAVVAAVVARRLGRLERRLDDLGSPRTPRSEDDEAAEPPSAAGPPTFPWLEPGSLGVFVPVLLGVGAILSALAYVVERVAAVTEAGPGASERLRAIELPDGPLDRTAAAPRTPSGALLSERRRAGPVGWVVTLLVAVLLITSVVVVLADVATYRPDPVSSQGSSAFAVSIDAREGDVDPTSVTRTLWTTCRGNLPSTMRLDDLEAAGPGTAVLVVAPEVGPNDGRRFVGCLEDLRLDGLRVDVEDVPEDPPPGPATGTPLGA